jgi:hypothetical protein
VDGVLTAARRRSVGSGLYAGTALGLLAGTKYLGLLYLPPILAVGAIAWWVERADPDPLSPVQMGEGLPVGEFWLGQGSEAVV